MNPQESIAHYRIVSKLGAGGMGEVWRATDTKLNREVAIKILPDAFASDPDRMARFQREAQVLASLNHPNIAAIYGVEDRALVMELVEGETLRGPLPLDTALEYSRQIAAALEAAHEKGIIHRDLKPANIKVTPDGVVKVLDFGLAKAAESNPLTSTADSPTLTIGATHAGLILGTAGYMAPEQAKGKAVDKRADIWAFGVVLYEMLTGEALFTGETVSDTLAAVLRHDPDLTRVPPQARKLLASCLEKDPKRRLRDIADARLVVDETPPVTATRLPSRTPWVLAGAALAMAALMAVVMMLHREPRTGSVAFGLPWPDGFGDPGTPALPQVAPSPDGRTLAFIAAARDGNTALWVRPIRSPLAHRLEGTEGAYLPFWSPDSQHIAFFAGPSLKRSSLTGGLPQTLCDLPQPSDEVRLGDGGAWSPSGVIVFSTGPGSPLLRVAAAGGPVTPVTALDSAAGETRHAWPQFMPDGRHLLYFAGNQDSSKSATYLQELGSPVRTLVMRSGTRTAWSPPGYLLFAKDRTLFAQQMDAGSMHLAGEPVPLADSITSRLTNGRASFETAGGVLVYRTFTSPGTAQLAWYGRDGRRIGSVGKPSEYLSVRLSGDDRSAVVSIGVLPHADVWTLDVTSGGLHRVTRDGQASFILGPWSPDGQRLAYNRAGGAGILEVALSSDQTSPAGPSPLYAADWSPDGRSVLCSDASGEHWAIIGRDGDQRVQPVTNLRSAGLYPRLAPDGKYVAYVSTESARHEIVVALFPSFGQKRQISLDGGDFPFWRKDGRELIFQSPDGTVMAAAVRTKPEKIEADVPKSLFKLRPSRQGAFDYWPTSDAQRFLVIERDQAFAPQTTVVVNWAAEMQK